ncbi:MAG TPA: D-tyrosyl-tRNA(Tyr) deacylase [Candidatus Coproplasma stercoripullorum]|uniref:D-aminoacyl-tRNA deacylase n=1 Tax=Candidatus Coproplasma stercoripullorum TaxID=2840751 RepID=A0A9D1DBD5_9FIRM|nr:D-tyrosyl-tRNA(Tyr) deacylase [Candidatus Coproplasma stercoripullorum]
MKAVIQRVGRTSLSVGGSLISEIPFGLAVYLGVKSGDTDDMPAAMAKKIAALRIFEDENGKMNLSVKDVGGEVLMISQFTLYGDCSHGNRPSFTLAERPERANELYQRTCEELKAHGVPVKTGVFGADMKIEQFNDGPVTIIYEI